MCGSATLRSVHFAVAFAGFQIVSYSRFMCEFQSFILMILTLRRELDISNWLVKERRLEQIAHFEAMLMHYTVSSSEPLD